MCPTVKKPAPIRGKRHKAIVHKQFLVDLRRTIAIFPFVVERNVDDWIERLDHLSLARATPAKTAESEAAVSDKISIKRQKRLLAASSSGTTQMLAEKSHKTPKATASQANILYQFIPFPLPLRLGFGQD